MAMCSGQVTGAPEVAPETRGSAAGASPLAVITSQATGEARIAQVQSVLEEIAQAIFFVCFRVSWKRTQGGWVSGVVETNAGWLGWLGFGCRGNERAWLGFGCCGTQGGWVSGVVETDAGWLGFGCRGNGRTWLGFGCRGNGRRVAGFRVSWKRTQGGEVIVFEADGAFRLFVEAKGARFGAAGLGSVC